MKTLPSLIRYQSFSRSCYYRIRQIRCIRPSIDFKMANTIACTSIVHYKLDSCNSLYFNLPKTQINRFQHTQNSLARTVTNTPKYSHITHVLKSLQWLKIEQCIQYKLISLTYKILTTSQPTYLHHCLHDILPPLLSQCYDMRNRAHSFVLPQCNLSLIHIWRCRRIERCRSRWSPYH